MVCGIKGKLNFTPFYSAQMSVDMERIGSHSIASQPVCYKKLLAKCLRHIVRWKMRAQDGKG